MAKLEWHHQQPYSTAYDDVYFSSDNGLAESDYVFIQGNHLHERWQTALPNQTFSIIETGFGTGLNFCCTAQAWLNSSAQGKLHFISIEKHPLSADAIQKALSLWPSLDSISELLCANYQTFADNQTAGKVSLSVLPNIKLTIYLGDVVDQLSLIKTKADAWFLDGFAPAKNPDMWQAEVFNAMASLSQLGTTVATFTSAGLVRRGLSDVGFNMQKRTGYGKKREMLIGKWQGLDDE